jgi:Heparinase II/III-like protein
MSGMVPGLPGGAPALARLRRAIGRRRAAGGDLPSENDLLREMQGRYGRFDEYLAALRQGGILFASDIPRQEARRLFLELRPERGGRIVQAADRLLAEPPARAHGVPPAHHGGVEGRHLLQHLPLLGQAVWLTGDGRYVERFRRDTMRWLESRERDDGSAVGALPDDAIRILSCVWAYGLLRDEILADPPFASVFLRRLFGRGRELMRALPSSPDPASSCRPAGLAALLFLGVLFRGGDEADVWKGTAIAGLERALAERLAPDGGAADFSLARHRLLLEIGLACLLLARRAGFVLPDLRRRLRAMTDLLAHCAKPDGGLPQIGTAADDRLQRVGDPEADRRDARPLLALAGCAFDDPSLFALGDDCWEEAFWHCGPAVAHHFLPERRPAPPQVTGALFGASGVAVLRDGDLYALLYAGPSAAVATPAPGRRDLLSVEVQALGEDLIVDPGVGPQGAEGERFAATAAHNTVRVDGREIGAAPAPLGTPPPDRPAGIRRFVSRTGFEMAEGEHHGYHGLAAPLLHRRLILLNRRTRRITIEDLLEGEGEHLLEWFFHLAPRCEAVWREETQAVHGRAGAVGFRLRPTLLPAGAVGRLEAGSFSRAPGRVEAAHKVRYEWCGRLPVAARFVIEAALESDP